MSEIILKNFTEEIVFDLVDDVLENMDICNCEKCKMDIIAMALNELPQKYVVSKKGELYSKVNSFKSQIEIDVVTAITRAAMIVKGKPQH